MPSYNSEMLAAQLRLRWPQRGAQATMARSMGERNQTVNKWFLGETMPEPSKWGEIESYCGWPAGYIRELVLPEGVDLAARLSDLSRHFEQLFDQVEAMSAHLVDLDARLAAIEAARGGTRSPRPRRPVG